ncbi:B-cell receptor CD22-like [Salminus brasiliensis]|uniref:B-cell receptor CD22-like n=1 Tax=Salminus brasiliensis TaxID=930266 RepID=UPI003B833663
MKLAETLTVLYWVFGVVWCSEFSVTLPDRVEAVRGLCVLVPCAFEIRTGLEYKFKGNLKGLWRKDGTEDSHTVFDSTTPETNQIKGEIRGDLSMKNCTTLFYSVRTADSGRYYFRIEGEDKYTYTNPSVYINISDSPPKPTLSVYVGQTEVEDRRVLEGSSVSLICSALAPCPSNPPTLTWSPLPLNSVLEQNQNTSFISSHLSFTASHLHHRLRINCSATYRLENNRTTRRAVVLRVEYPPRNTTVSVSPSGPVLLGGSVSLSCSSDGNPAVLNYTWYRENGEQIETGDTLTITETDDTHSGLYYCRAENQHGTQNSSVRLDVQYPPRNTTVSVSPSGPVLLGGSVSLSCSSDGNPAVLNYTWYRENGEQIETGDTLTITETDDTHSGLYYCRAENQHGTQNSSVQLDVQYPPRNMTVSVSPSGPVLLGGSVSLSCSSDGNPAVLNYTWYRENGEQIETGDTLTITETDDTHSGLYYCRAENQHGTQNSSVQLDVQYPPRNTTVSVSPSGPVLLGGSVSLSCSSDGNPAVLNYTWYRENGEQISGHNLFINKPDDTHSDLYNCRAENQLKTQNSSVQRDVQHPQKNKSGSPCEGNPAVNQTWNKQKREQIETGDTLTITETDDTHSGLYYCRAENQHGTQNSSVQLDIQYPPRNTTVSVSPSGPVLLGGSVSLSCSSDGNPAVLNYTWYRENGEQIETGDTLTINTTNYTDSGLYYCRAENQHGTQNSSVQLDVQYAPQVSFSSHCNGSSEGGIECVCEVHGFPVPKLEWRLSGQSVPPPANSSIREEHLGNTGIRSFISLRQSPTDTPTLQCIGSNHLGSTAQLFHSVAPGSCSPTVGPFHVFSVLVGAAIGAFAVMLLCTVYVFRRRVHHKPSNKESAGLILNERAVCQDDEEESLNCNKSSKLALSHRNPDILHYSTISFPNGEEGSGEIRGLSSLTPEYATVQHGYREQCEGETAEDVVAEDKETKAYEMVQPSEEEVTYGNIVRHKAALPDVDVSVNLEQTKPEQLTPSAEAEGLYAEVKHKPELRASKK